MSDTHGLVTNFNSFKSLVHYDRMLAALNGNPHAPVTIEIDPVAACNHGCWFCIAEQFMGKTPAKEKIIDADSVISYIRRFYDWGVRGIVFVGGGEPTLHPRFDEMVIEAKKAGLELGLISNGSKFDKWFDIIAENFRWVGCSIDAADAETHAKLHITNKDEFASIIHNLWKLSQAGVQTTYKYVLSPWNLNIAERAIQIASKNGIDQVYYRPAYMGMFDNTPSLQERQNDEFNYYDVYDPRRYEKLWSDVEATIVRIDNYKTHFPDVKTFVSKAKVEAFMQNNRSPKCHATPLLAVMSGDNKIHLCCDRREEDFLTLCDFTKEDFIELWGSERHLEILRSIDVKKCPRCRLEIHNQIMDSLDNDNMQINFI